MAFSHGKSANFQFATKDLSAFCDNIDFSNAVDMAETSTFGTEAKTYVSGLSDATIAVSGKWDPTATTGPDAVLDPLVGSDTVSAWIYGPNGLTTGNVKYSGNGFVTSYKVTSPIGGVVSFTADIQVTGAVVRGVY